MKPLTLDEVRQAIHGYRLAAGSPVTVSTLSTDTRTAAPGDLFVAIRGRNFDGHVFLPQAAQAGCVAAVVHLDGEPRPEVARRFRGGVIGVPDTVKALGDLAGRQRATMRAVVVGVTGSNGKTTVKRMIDHILSKRLRGACSPKSFNNQIGVPLTLLEADGGEDYVVCELGTNAPGEIAALTAIARPNVAVITSVSHTHLAGLGSLDKVIAEKASILARMPGDALAVVWADNPTLVRLAGSYMPAAGKQAGGRRMVTFGQADGADLRMTGYQSTGRGQRFQINGREWVELGLPGRHNASNALAAIAVARRFGFSREDAAAALADFKGVAMRLEWMDLPTGARPPAAGRPDQAGLGGITLINDAYNANPASMLAAAQVLSDVAARRRVLVAGDMGELGEQAEELHLGTGRQIADTRVDLLIGVGPLGRYIAEGAARAGLETAEFDTIEAAGEALARTLQPGDAVLIKASRAARMERIVDYIKAAWS